MKLGRVPERSGVQPVPAAQALRFTGIDWDSVAKSVPGFLGEL